MNIRIRMITGFWVRLLLFSLALIPMSFSFAQGTTPESQAPEANYTSREGVDFATRNLGDPWDMSEFTDINQWLNHTGAQNALLDIQVQNGVFSARTASGSTYFFTLFGGYTPAMYAGKIGTLHPISSSAYACFYMAMNVQTQSSPDYYLLSWGDQYLPPTISGMAYGLHLTPSIWKLYQIDLTSWPYITGMPWTGRALWQSLRITPSLSANAIFAVDWIRLTDCQPVYVTLSSLSAGTYSLWVGTGSPERQILAVDTFSPQANGSYPWDVQGIAAGTYHYYVKAVSGGQVVQQGQVTIVATPIINFSHPSPINGIDYATAAGNAWDMDPSDLVSIACANPAYANSLLLLDTLPPSQLPPGCVGPGAGEADPRLYLNTPDHGNLSVYRYFSFSAYMSGAWSVPEQGMVVRLIWRLDRPGEDCYYVSREIALDVGWHTYVIDLYDAWNGSPNEVTPANCPMVNWKDQAQVGPLVAFRLDPNENITGNVFHQEIDWIRLTRVDSVQRGTVYLIRISPNKPRSELNSLTFFYTDDLANPTQHLARLLVLNPPPTLPFKAYLPLIGSNASVFQTGDPFLWDTSTVTPGVYYICTVANDGYNQAYYCSDSPVEVTVP